MKQLLFNIWNMTVWLILVLIRVSGFLWKFLSFIFIIYSVQVKELQNPETVFNTILGIVVRLAEHGLIHCDFNEFNIMVCV